MSIDSIVDRVGGDPGYVKFLITERHAIRSALEAKGVCFDDEARIASYSNSIGNDLHLDLIEVEQWIVTLPRGDQKVLDDWGKQQSTRPLFGGTMLGRINRLVGSYLNGQKASSERGRHDGRTGMGVPVSALRGVEEVGSDTEGRGVRHMVQETGGPDTENDGVQQSS